jgi:hypothetical protein
MKNRVRVIVAAGVWLAAAALAACGSGSEQPAAKPADQAGTPAFETRWLRGVFADDVKAAVGKAGLACKGPNIENKSSVWQCQSATPLVAYQLTFYGSAPAKIEYVHAVVIQSGAAKTEPLLQLFGALAGLHFDGGDAPQAREWLAKTLEAGGTTEIGPAKYTLGGDANRRVFDIKAKGSEW